MPINAPLQPIVASKFRVLFKNLGAVGADCSKVTGQVKSTELPTICFFLKVEKEPPTFAASRAMWRPITIRLRDDITNAAMGPILLQCARQDIANGTEQEQDIKFAIGIELFGNATTVVRSYEITGCLIESVTSADFSYDQHDPAEFSISVHYQDVKVIGGSGVTLW